MRAYKSKPVHDGDVMPTGIRQPVKDSGAAKIRDSAMECSCSTEEA